MGVFERRWANGCKVFLGKKEPHAGLIRAARGAASHRDLDCRRRSDPIQPRSASTRIGLAPTPPDPECTPLAAASRIPVWRAASGLSQEEQFRPQMAQMAQMRIKRSGLVKAELRAVSRAVKAVKVGARLRIDDVNKASGAVGGEQGLPLVRAQRAVVFDGEGLASL